MKNAQQRNGRNLSNPRNAPSQRISSIEEQRTRGLSQNAPRSQQPSTAGNSARPLVNLDQFTTSQKNINSGIFEYLLKFGFHKTVETLQQEIN
jgi:hypothetical protein